MKKLLCIILSLTFFGLLVAQHQTQASVVISYDRSMSMFRNFMGYPEKDQMSAGDFKRVNAFVVDLLENGYFDASKKLGKNDIASTYFENGSHGNLVQKLKSSGINQNVYYFDFGGKVYNQGVKSLPELRHFLKNSLPLARDSHTFLNNKQAFWNAFPELQTDLPCAACEVYEQYLNGNAVIWINISDNQISLDQGSACQAKLNHFKNKFIEEMLLDVGFNNYVHVTMSLILPIGGCTDPAASNFNPNASMNDGTCQYPPSGFFVEKSGNSIVWNPPAGSPPFTYFIDDKIVESPYIPTENGQYVVWAMNCHGKIPASINVDDITTEADAPISAPPSEEDKGMGNKLLLGFLLVFGLLGAAS